MLLLVQTVVVLVLVAIPLSYGFSSIFVVVHRNPKSSLSSSSAFSPDGPNGWKPDAEEQQQANGASSKSRRPTSADPYESNELNAVLKLHLSLSENKAEDDSVSLIGGLHDLVLQALEEDDIDHDKKDNTNKIRSSIAYNEIVDRLQDRIQNIRAIASDVDGTLLDSHHGLHPRTRLAILKAVEAAQSPDSPLLYFFLATGKSRQGAMTILGPEIAQVLSQMPGVFNQGLYCVNASGQVVYEQKLSPSHETLIATTEEMVNDKGLTLLGYDGDVLYTTQSSFDRNPHHWEQVNTVWGEPKPILLETFVGYTAGFHKLIVMADTVEEILAVRPSFQHLADVWNASVTSAIPTMLEILPPNASKAVGVKQLCQSLGIDMSTELLALGDGENDLEFLQQAAIGVAMGNAATVVKEANGVDVVLKETNSEGGAGLAMEIFGRLVADPQYGL